MISSLGNVVTEHIGALPMVADYLKRMRFIEAIDTMVKPLRSNHRRLTHGETCFILVLYLLCRPHVMCKVEDWVRDNTYLKVLFPHIEPEHFTDDRIGDTFKALQAVGIRDLFSAQSINIIGEFALSMEQVHCDFTNFLVHGDFKKADGENSILITYGFDKKGIKGKKQFNQEVAVTADGGVPIMTKTLDGNTADVTRYTSLWRDIEGLMGSSNFITVGDCKLSSDENLLTIAKGKGYFLAPLAMYSTLKEELYGYVLSGEKSPILLKTQQKDGKKITFHGFEVSDSLVDKKTGKAYEYRKIFVLSSQLKDVHEKSLESRLDKALDEIKKLESKLNRFKSVDSTQKIGDSIEAILSKYEVKGLIDYRITEEIEVVKKKIGRGRSGPNSIYREEEVKTHSLVYSMNESAIEDKRKLCGYFVLATNKPKAELPTANALSSYKQEWMVERVFERLKGPLQVVPIYLQLPEHIEAMMYLLMTCAQIFTLMDREAKNSLAAKDEKLEGLFPNKRKVSRPRAEVMMDAFGNIGLSYRAIGDGVEISVGGLNPLQGKILEITGINPIGYSTQYIVGKLNTEEVEIALLKMINTLLPHT